MAGFCSCLKAIRKLQKNGHLPAESEVFHLHAKCVDLVDG
jgi:hypothetical protein